MALITLKPTSPGRRSAVRVTSPDLHKGGPYQPLTQPQSKTGGRNNNGHITTRHRGGGHRQHYRLIDFKRAYPGIVLDVVFENRVVDLMRDEVDIAVRVMTDPPDNLVARDMGPVRYVACATPGYAQAQGMPATLEDLSRAPLVTSAVVGRQLRLAAYLEGERHEVPLSPTLTSENFLFLREAIVAGLGVGLVPDYVVQDLVSRGEMLTALDNWKLSIFGTQMFMLYMPNRHHTRAASTFIDFMLAQVRQGA